MSRLRVLMVIKRFAPLAISMTIATVFVLTHVLIQLGLFRTGPLSQRGLLHYLDLKTLDLKFVGREMEDIPEPKVIVAAIDERGVERYGLWPWSRAVIADFIRKAGEGGAKVIAFDAVFSDEDRNSSYVSVKRFLDAYSSTGLKGGSDTLVALTAYSGQGEDGDKDGPLAKLEAKLKQLPAKQRQVLNAAVDALRKERKRNAKAKKELQKKVGALRARSNAYYELMEKEVAAVSPDAALASAIKAHADKVVLGYFNFYNEKEIVGVSLEEARSAVDRLEPVAIRQIYDIAETDFGKLVQPVEDSPLSGYWVRESVGTRAPLAAFTEVAKYFGYFNAVPDGDGPFRRLRLFNRKGESLYPALSVAAAALYFDGAIRPLDHPIFPGQRLKGIDALSPEADDYIPTTHAGHFLLNYYKNPEEYFPTYSVADFVDGTLDPATYKDKVVIFGMTAQGLSDLRPTSFSGTTPGVYIHATAIQNMIDGHYLSRFYGMELIEALAYLILGLAMGLVLPRVPAWAGILATTGFATGLYFVDTAFIFPRGTWLLNVLPTLQVALSFIGINAYGYFTEGREKRQIRKAFQFYLTKSVVDDVLKNTEKLKLGGEKRVCTVLFSDIRGFTTISERLTPEELSNLLNEYLTPMTNLVFEYDGTLDKYMGDAIMAIFGAPVDYKDHAARACYVALDMMTELARLQVGWRERGVPELDIGIGMNTGAMSVGNMGSEIRFDYTVMGDNVNLGSRLEGINKQYGTNIIISESTFEAAKDDIIAREMDSVRVKGKREPVKIYELLGKGAGSNGAGELIQSFEQGIVQYKAQKWDEAIATFEKVRGDLKPGDFASGMYIDRCVAMRQDPPGEDWDGVFTMTTK